MTIDRVEDAWRRLQSTLAGRPVPPLVLVIGLDRGDLLRALDRHAPGTAVLALEPEPGAARALQSQSEWSRWRESGRLTYLVGPDYAGASDAPRLFPLDPNDHVLVVDPAIAAHASPAAVEAARTLKKIVYGARANAEARQQFAMRYLTNSLRNARAIAAGHDVRALADAYRGVPAVIAAAGPSLDDVVDELRDVRQRALLISVDTALRPLLSAGVSPHLAVGLDPSELNARHFHGLPQSPDTWLVSESALDPSASQHFGDRTFWFRVANHHPWPWLRELGLDVGLLEVWGSVVTAAFQVAVLAGCDPIVMVGADLSYTHGRPYCRGTTYEFDWAHWVAAGAVLEEVWGGWTDAPTTTRVADVRGVETATSPPLMAFRDWLVAHASRSGRRVVNATGAGLFFGDGITQSSLADVLQTDGIVAPVERVVPRTSRPVDHAALASAFRSMRPRVAAEPDADVVAQWTAFTGTGWNSAAAVSALDGAATELEVGAAPPPPEAHPAPRWILQQLPESIARWRSMLAGGEFPPPLIPVAVADGTGSPSYTVDAFEVMSRVTGALFRQRDDPTPAVPRDDRLPLAALEGWPAFIARDVLVFEAMLGAMSPSRASEPIPSFFAGLVVPRNSGSATPQPPAGSSGDRLDRTVVATRLAVEWTACVTALSASPAANTRAAAHASAWRTAALSGLRAASLYEGERSDATLVLAVRSGGRSRATTVPIHFDVRAMARAETGLVREEASVSEAPAARRDDRVDVDVARSMRFGDARSVAVAYVEGGIAPPRANVFRVLPRIRTDEGIPRSFIAYATPRGAVCVTPFAYTSYLMREDGDIEECHVWPLPIVGELPWGERGLVAWSNCADNFANTNRGYVMRREAPDAPVIVEDVPFRPSHGAWLNGRLHWICFTTGLGVWKPGEAASTHLADTTLFALTADADGAVITPCVRSDYGSIERRIARSGWRWTSDSAPERTAFGSEGGPSSRAVAEGWTATAYPEADVIRLDSGSGRSLLLTCYYPFRLAWIGRSLLACTAHGELLLFERILDAIDPVDRGR